MGVVARADHVQKSNRDFVTYNLAGLWKMRMIRHTQGAEVKTGVSPHLATSIFSLGGGLQGYARLL